MQQTLAKMRNLEKFIQKHGDDSVISLTITKMLDYKIQKYNEEIVRLNKGLKKYERKYRKESPVFFDEFKSGRLGDDMDFIEWASLYKMRNNLLKKKTELERAR